MLLPYEVEWALARVFEQDLKNFSEIQIALELLNNSHDFTSLDAFKIIDINNMGYITIDTLEQFTKSCDVMLSSDELFAFFRVVDLDEDGRISYTELLEAITSCPNYFSSKLNDTPVLTNNQ